MILVQASLHEYRTIKEQLSHWFQSLADLPVASEVRTGSSEDSLTVKTLLHGLASQTLTDTFTVAVVGEYSSGKSSLLNVILRLHADQGRKTEGLLPTAITPTTAVVTTLVYDGERRIEITLDDGRELPVSAEQLNGFLTEPTLRRRKFWWTANADENEHLAAHITKVRIGCVSPLLGEGVELVDTPGIGSINKDHAHITKEFTARADAALFLVSVDPPMGEHEMTFLQHIKTITDRCLFVQTKRDLGERTEQGEKVWQRREREHRRRIEHVLERRDYPFYCISAYQAASGLRNGDKEEFKESGVAELEAELQRFLVAGRGVPRIQRWIKHGRDACNQLETALRIEREQLDDELAGIAQIAVQEEDYAQWKQIDKALKRALDQNRREAMASFSHAKDEFANEVMQEAQRELALTTGKQLAESSNRRLQIERTIVRSIQYHRSDLLMPIFDRCLQQARDISKEALGEAIPAVFQQFANPDFDWAASPVDITLNSFVETRKYIQETRRGGLGVIDFFFGPVQKEITEHNIDKQRFTTMVEKTTENTYREIKSEASATLKEASDVVNAEMDRIVTAARDSADHAKRIQQQDKDECSRQLRENKSQNNRLAELNTRLKELSASADSLAPPR